MVRRPLSRFAAIALIVALASLAASTLAADPVRIAHIDPFSGPFALVGQSVDRHLQAAVDDVNAHGGVLGGRKLELVPLDNKTSPMDSLIQLKAATDQGIHFLFQANGSNVAHALTEAVAKHNARNPDNRVLYMNFGAVDPALTNEKCNFWHFRLDAHADMKLDAITNDIAHTKSVKKVYLINQDYAFGQAVSRGAREMLAKKRADIDIVGDDLHPMGKVKDFSPYVAKIKAAGADTVITGNWGPDLSLLVRAAKDAGLSLTFYGIYAYLPGAPTAIGEAGAGHVKTVLVWHQNIFDDKLEAFVKEYRKKYKEDYWFNGKGAIDTLVKAIEDAKSDDPYKVARQLENMKFTGITGETWMRPDDHQLMQPLYIATFTKAGGEVKYDAEGTGFGWKTDSRIEWKDTVMPHTCKMERP